MAFCNKCGSKIKSNVGICPKCGNLVANSMGDTKRNKHKKRKFEIVFFLVAIFAVAVVGVFVLVGQAKNNKAQEVQNTTLKESVLSPESAVDIYMAYSDLWMENPEYMPRFGYGYCLIDLDFDGVLELINSVTDGSNRGSFNKFYKINLESLAVEEIQLQLEDDSMEYDGVDYNYMSNNSKILKNTSTNELFYLFENYFQVTGEESILSYAECFMEDGEIYENYLFDEYRYLENGNQIVQYFFEGEEVTKAEYESLTGDIYANNKDMSLVWEPIQGDKFDNSSYSEQRQMMLDAYRKFSYEGFSFGEVETYELERSIETVCLKENYYYNIDDSFPKYAIPCVLLHEDGTFVLEENLAAGWGCYKGTYHVIGNRLLLFVTYVDFSNFEGDDVEVISFTINDQNTITLNTNLCLSMKGHVFSTDQA